MSHDTGYLSGHSCCHATLTSKIKFCNSPEELCDLSTCSGSTWETTKSQGQASGLGQAGATPVGVGRDVAGRPQGPARTRMELFLPLSVTSPGSGRLTVPFPVSSTTALTWGSHAAQPWAHPAFVLGS